MLSFAEGLLINANFMGAEGGIKVFKIIGNRYRNKRKRYDLKFNIVAGLVNLQNGLSLLKRAA
ncbi:hypothetical protein [Cardinium endosymbiont of Tipula unca]|uniref:hypothetical protein n=1 Tax=Cardinium endosymbiont of Tipula unca TaxID=3066216 RepID=UPI0030D5C8CA